MLPKCGVSNMKNTLGSAFLLLCLWSAPLTSFAQEQSPTPEIVITASPVEVRSDVHIDVQQPAPAPAPPPDVNIQVRESAPPAPSVVKTDSTKETSVTKIETAAPVDSGTNVMYLLVGGTVALALGLGIYSVSKGR